MLRRVSIAVPTGRAEELRARFVERFPDGFEEVDRGSTVELAAYVDAVAEAVLRTELPELEGMDVEEGWEERWKEFHRPLAIGRLWIGPPWEEPPPGATAVVIDPGRAFGTGAHPTTRLCLELLQEQAPAAGAGGSLLDVGCGSGVLSIAAVKLGFAPVLAVDVDPLAVEVTLANAAANGVALEARHADGLVEPLPSADLAVANVLLEPVRAIAARVRSPLLIASGYLAGDELGAAGWTLLDRRELDGWAADLLVRQ